MAADPNRHTEASISNTWAELRFYAELNVFLEPRIRQTAFCHTFSRGLTVRQVLENLGIPSDQVDLILVNGTAAQFDYILDRGDRVSVYPVFEAFDIAGVSRLRDSPLRQIRFVLDVHLGKLARFLRMLGFDALYRNDFTDRQIIAAARREKRIVLSRDKELLQNRMVTHGYGIRQTRPSKQIREVLERFQLERALEPFTRCLECNRRLEPISKDAVHGRLPPYTLQKHDDFSLCPDCHRIYWKGSHYGHMLIQLNDILQNS
jgi:uncharacterized protein with PIN domain/sulfur carrier protein ThiS